MTPSRKAALQSDLDKLALIPDDVIRSAARQAWVKEVASRFQVQVGLAELRLAGIGPYLPYEQPTDAGRRALHGDRE